MLWNFAVEEHHHYYSKRTFPKERPHSGPAEPYLAAVQPKLYPIMPSAYNSPCFMTRWPEQACHHCREARNGLSK